MKKRTILFAALMSVALLGNTGCGNEGRNAETPANGTGQAVQEDNAEDTIKISVFLEGNM